MSVHQLRRTIDGASLSIFVQDAIRRVIDCVQRQQFSFDVTTKVTGTKSEDVVTSADFAAQRIYVELLRNRFPTWGIVAEENQLRVAAPPDMDVWWTVDPVDGTLAFARQQSHGVATMLALVLDGQIVAAGIGDISTGEIYYHEPDSRLVQRVTHHGQQIALGLNQKPLDTQHLLMRKNPLHLPPWLQPVCRSHKYDQAAPFHDIEVDHGSIGCMFARLWKREVGGLLLIAGSVNPWDRAPVLGATALLEYEWLELSPGPNGRIRANVWQPTITTEIQEQPVVLIVPRTAAGELRHQLGH